MSLYESLSSREKENFKRVSNKLLSVCFLCKKKEDTKTDYYFAESKRDVLNEYFEPLGFEVEVNRNLGVAQLINKFNHNKVNLKLIESITLLILRILYHEKMEELSLSEHVLITVSEIQEKFIALNFKDRLMDKTSLSVAFRTLKRFNLLKNMDRDMTLGDSRLIIYPSVLMAVKMENISDAYKKLETYTRKGVNDNEEINRD